MTAIEFCYWLQGFFEHAGTQRLNAKHAQAIQQRLATVPLTEAPGNDVIHLTKTGNPMIDDYE